MGKRRYTPLRRGRSYRGSWPRFPGDGSDYREMQVEVGRQLIAVKFSSDSFDFLGDVESKIMS